jgi:hypothetical protein
MDRFEPFRRHAHEDLVLRWAGVGGLGLVWLSVAWMSVVPLLWLVELVGIVYLYRRRHPFEPRDEELDVL